MTSAQPPSEEDLHAFIDGELPADRSASIEQALADDPHLAARVAAFQADKQALAALYAPLGRMPVPASWIARIDQAAARPPTRTTRARLAPWLTALAACIMLAILGTALLRPHGHAADPILAEAEAARADRLTPVQRLTEAAIADVPGRDAGLARAVGLKLRAPDLARLGWHLVRVDTYAGAAALRYRTDAGQALTLYIRRSTGEPRFDLLHHGRERICIWQDEVVSAVMMGDMTAGAMMRVASAAYLELNL